MSSRRTKVLISASGTGGHLIPAQQLAVDIQKKGGEVFFAAADLSKKTFFQKDNFSYLDISSSYLNRKNLFLAFFKILKGLIQSLKLIRRYKPDVVVGFGSYHTFPVMLASFLLMKKIVLFDSNVVLGKVNRVFSKKAKYIAVQFNLEKKLKNEILIKRFPWITNEILKKDFNLEIGLDKNVFTILIFGGSQGSKIINDNFISIIEKLKQDQKIQVIHILGKGSDLDKYKKIYDDLSIKSYVSAFEKDLFNFYVISDLVISRSGACSILELIHFEKPSILIPFKNAKENHQYKNAIFMRDVVKSSAVIEEDRLTQDVLLEEILSFFRNDKSKISIFRKNSQIFKITDDKNNKKEFSDLVLEIGSNKL
ncbi:MAG: UDP-N-acetylglucosamine--N-acetylmuramyl-(pentapeptide) pyrophosphoryl-undecaprenol N-acetylglucosamine transferase [Parachlamydiales bacterium]|jgi:UDP-N-acetylglucosamine--N-acetylmuramyl-(pentapeptide) pyrophosphoryl-undecaprenol N-acetylglucosamine transferase